MTLLTLIAVLLLAALLAWISGKWSPVWPRVVSITALSFDLVLLIFMVSHPDSPPGAWIIDEQIPWIPRFGITLHFALDGLSLLMLLLTLIIGILAVLVSWKEIGLRPGFYHFNLLLILAGIAGVFVAVDLFLFYFFWELMLVPMYFLIGIWGHEKRTAASYKFFLYTQAGGLLMFIAILALYFIHAGNTGIYTFDYFELLGTSMNLFTAMIIMWGFLAAFLVKLPVVPLHNWLPDAHTEAPTAGSLILAALLLKSGAYGLLRFVVPLFPAASAAFAPLGMLLGVTGILYGAKLAFAQTDLKRLVAYTSVSHMGFVILGVFAFSELAWQGVVMQMIVHGVSTGALFILVGQLSERIHTREMGRMGGLWEKVPFMGAIGMIFALASLGLPGMGNFIAELLVLTGVFRESILMSSLAGLGLIAATVYALRIMQKVFFGQANFEGVINDLNMRERWITGTLVLIIFVTGIFPQPVIRTAKPAIRQMLNIPRQNGDPAAATGRPDRDHSVFHFNKVNKPITGTTP